MKPVHDLLARLTAALNGGDFDGFIAECALPYLSLRDEATLFMEDAAAMRAQFEQQAALITRLPRLRIRQDVLAVHPQGASILSVTALATCTLDDRPAVDPVTNILILRLVGNDWKLAASLNPILPRLTRLEPLLRTETPT